MKIGSFVVCIDDKFSNKQLDKLKILPKEGDYYTIRDIIDYPNLGRTGVRLEEISNPPIKRSDGSLFEPTFNIFRFRELDIPSSLTNEITQSLSRELELTEIEDDGLFRKIRN